MLKYKSSKFEKLNFSNQTFMNLIKRFISSTKINEELFLQNYFIFPITLLVNHFLYFQVMNGNISKIFV